MNFQPYNERIYVSNGGTHGLGNSAQCIDIISMQYPEIRYNIQFYMNLTKYYTCELADQYDVSHMNIDGMSRTCKGARARIALHELGRKFRDYYYDDGLPFFGAYMMAWEDILSM